MGAGTSGKPRPKKKKAPEKSGAFFFFHCHGPQMRAIQMTPPFYLQDNREPNWMAHTPVGHDS
jgi:hypothetical protein